jgi:formylglycine-generating enzyme required for sulfatase activity
MANIRSISRGARRSGPLSGAALLAGFCVMAVAQTAAPTTPPPRFPAAAAFDAKLHPLSARQQGSMARIPGGTYRIGSPPGHPLADPQASPEHQVDIKPFRLDRTEVTNAQFAEFLNAMPLKPSGTAAGGKVGLANIPRPYHPVFLEFSSRPSPYTLIDLDDTEALIGVREGRFAPNAGFENHPVTETTWAGALAYCRWRGARLPTEVEWEAAARGLQGRTFPWGDAAPTTGLAVINRPSGDLLPVGSAPRGATPEGILDLAGSLLEWTSTLARPYPYRPDDGREDPTAPGERAVRGGNYVFDDAPERLTGWNRTVNWRNPATGHRQIGVRCAAD